MPSLVIAVNHEAGLHARPMSLFVKIAKQYESNITVKNLSRDKGPVNGKSPLNILVLAVTQGQEIEITAEGPDADEALSSLKALIENNFEIKEA